jgi:hypothetical protein
MTDLMPWEEASQYVNPLSLIESQKFQRWVLRAMWDATNELKTVRDLEVEAEQAFQSARRRAFFREDCPIVTRGATTVADRDAWIDREVEDLEEKWKPAKATTQAAKDRMDTIRSQAVLISALAKTTSLIHSTAGVDR